VGYFVQRTAIPKLVGCIVQFTLHDLALIALFIPGRLLQNVVTRILQSKTSWQFSMVWWGGVGGGLKIQYRNNSRVQRGD
jgi:hypothetical protein